uniref:Resistance to inhibitors of cholinesterase protein 3 N-terminal domain-containing protein n=1 Tax=Glossina austeni TaxID=7395 RepID=A0A1A9V281_GLOAU
MPSKAQSSTKQPVASHPIYLNEGLSSKKTILIIVTVVGCIAILWPKVFYPMMFGGSKTVKTDLKETQRGPGAIRQERPVHLHPDAVYQAMRERGRAIPATPTIPIVDRKVTPSNPPPRIVEGRPGPIPGMRPPLGAGAMHQPQTKGSSMGIIMPLYTIGIVVFFGYTIMKIVFKKPIPNAPYGPAPSDPNFRKQVFGYENGRHLEDLNGSKLVVAAIQGLIDAADEELKLRETSTSESIKKTHEKTTTNKENISNGHANVVETSGINADKTKHDHLAISNSSKLREGSTERTIAVLGMEITASCEGGQKWSGRPPTPVLLVHHEHGILAHESQILVADSEIKQEKVYDAELNGSADEPAVVLSSKMTLSLINLDSISDKHPNKTDIESPLADDIEIIGHDEN